MCVRFLFSAEVPVSTIQHFNVSTRFFEIAENGDFNTLQRFAILAPV
jgi:hypothetical protein